ncbi:MAG: TonB-dependent receptor [Chitinophagaceae bacterium]|nr:TonB-dependent receptor [Chitinophagaceae bacterium]
MRRTLLFLCMLLAAGQFYAQNRTIRGKVTDEKGAPLANASVVVKGTSTGANTDNDGNFSVSVSPTAKALVISSLGYAEQEINISGKTSVSVSLKAASANLDEVVVIAYGTQSRVRTTGATTKISGEQFTNMPITSIDAMLQGKAAGLQSVAASGQPGALSQVRIRGIGSISASSAPLFVVDGIPVVTGDGSQILNSSNLLAGINPDDIEDLTVLKDAAATSIYGSRAANGVVLITTKTGKVGKARYNVSSEIGSNDIAYFPAVARPLDRSQLQALTIEGIKNVGGTQADIDAILAQYGYNSSANYNWLDLVTRKGMQQQANASVSGGTANSTYFLSGGYFKQESPVIGSDFKRYSASLKATLKASEKLSFGAGANISTFRQTGESEGSSFRNPIIDALALRPSQEAYKADGSPEWTRTIYEQLFNPLAIIQYDHKINNTSKVLGNFDATYKILSSLILKARYGIDYSNIEETQYLNPFFGDARPPTNGSFFATYRRIFNQVFSTTVEYNRKFLSNKLDMNLLAGHENQKTVNSNIVAGGTGVPLTTSVTFPSVSTPTSSTPIAQTDNSIESYLSRALFTYDNRYNLSLSFRRDGSSRFAEGRRWGSFWSVGGSWNIDREKFFSNIKAFSYLKLRASYGTSGNNTFGDYAARPTYTFGTTTAAANGIAASGTYNGQPASAPANVGNPTLTWEKNKSFDVGIEGALWSNRISFDIGYYNRKTYDLLLNDPLSPTSGFQTFGNNIGSMENKGIEVTANFVPVQTRDFRWDIGFNAAWNQNKVLTLSASGADILRTANQISRVGADFQSYYTRLWAGADPANGNPLWYVDDTKGATVSDISKANRVIIGSASPKGFGGANTSLKYRNFSLSANFYFQYGNLVNDQWGFIYTSDGALPNLNKNQKELRRWQKPGDITDIPRYDYGNANSSNGVSTRYFYKGDFIRLRTLMVAYDMPSALLKKWNMSGFTFYVRGNNIWTKTYDPQLAIDPEQPINGLANNQFFIPKSYTVGVNISF